MSTAYTPTRNQANLSVAGIFYNIAACLDNVIIPKTLIAVVCGTESIMDAQMTCLRELVQFKQRVKSGSMSLTCVARSSH